MSQFHKYCLSNSRNIRPHYKTPNIAENCWVKQQSLTHSLNHSLKIFTSSLITWWRLSWLLFCLYDVLFYLSFVFAVEFKPPTNINITTSGNNVTVTWTLPGESEKFAFLSFQSSGRTKKSRYIRTPQSSSIITLSSCKKYTLAMSCTYSNSKRSKRVMTTFWVTGK